MLGKTVHLQKADEATKSAAELRKKQLEEMNQAILASPCIQCSSLCILWCEADTEAAGVPWLKPVVSSELRGEPKHEDQGAC